MRIPLLTKRSPSSKKVKRDFIRRFGRIDLLPYEVEEGSDRYIGIARDRVFGTHSVVQWAQGHSSQDLTPEMENELVDGWSRFFDYFSGASTHRLCWRFQTVMGEAVEADRLVRELNGVTSYVGSGNGSQGEILDHTTFIAESAVRHDVSFTLTLSDKKNRRRIKSEGGIGPVIRDEATDFYYRAMSGNGKAGPLGITSLSTLSYNQLLRNFVMSIDPVGVRDGDFNWFAWEDTHQNLKQDLMWPSFADFKSDDFCRVGSTYHFGFCIDGFPDSGLFSSDFFELIRLPVTKTVSVVLDMIPHSKAQRGAEYRTTGTKSRNDELAGKGRRVTAQQDVDFDEEAQVEQDLAHRVGEVGDCRVYIDVTADSLEELVENCRSIKDMADSWSYVLYPLNGRHLVAPSTAMPIGRGLESIVPS